MIWVYESRGPFEKLRRFLQAQKFYRTLSTKLDKAEQEWRDSQPKAESDKEYIEHKPDGSMAQRLLGGAMQVRYKFIRKDEDLSSR